MRALAVLAVVLFHAGLGVPGGYVGVDVFFVISGYLITALIIRDLQAGRFSLKGFWERRVRRIVPALVVMVVATLAAGWFLLLPQDYAALGRSAAFQAAFAANFHFWKVTENGYFAGQSDEIPLLHTWSLAVEEQFYMIVPLLLVLLFRFPRLRAGRALLLLFSGAIIISLLASHYGVRHHPSAAFYLLPTRAWELLLGSLVAILPFPAGGRRRVAREVLSYAGLAGILVPCAIYNSESSFPGLLAIPPCLGSALIIWSNSRFASAGRCPTSLGTILSGKGLVFVGLISYSLYLWHWPVLAFARYFAGEDALSTGQRAWLMGAAFGMAVLSWRFVETPFRKRKLAGSRPAIFTVGLCSTLLSGALGVMISVREGIAERLPAELRSALAGGKDDYLFVAQMKAADIRAGNFTMVGKHHAGRPVSVLIWGDSHAMSAMPAFDAALRKQGINGRAVTHSSTAPVVDYWSEQRYGLSARDALDLSDEVVSYVRKNRIPHVVMAACWSAYSAVPSKGAGETARPFPEAILETTGKLRTANCQVWVLLQVPLHPLNPMTQARHRWATLPDFNDGSFCARPNSWNGITDNDQGFLRTLEQAGVRIIDPREAFLNEQRDRYEVVRNGVFLYRDNSHLTKAGAEMVLLPLLERTFMPFLAPLPAEGAPLPAEG